MKERSSEDLLVAVYWQLVFITVLFSQMFFSVLKFWNKSSESNYRKKKKKKLLATLFWDILERLHPFLIDVNSYWNQNNKTVLRKKIVTLS